jgi:hypothetical protein
MTASARLRASALFIAAALFAASPAFAQGSAEPKGQEQPKAGETGRDAKKVDEFAEAQRALSGPAANPECVWLGRRVVNLLWRDDLDTAFRHLDLYDRFGCPGGHIQVTFRCVVRQGGIDPKAPESLSARVHACWINPNLAPQPAERSQSSGANPAQ